MTLQLQQQQQPEEGREGGNAFRWWPWTYEILIPQWRALLRLYQEGDTEAAAAAATTAAAVAAAVAPAAAAAA